MSLRCEISEEDTRQLEPGAQRNVLGQSLRCRSNAVLLDTIQLSHNMEIIHPCSEFSARKTKRFDENNFS